MGEKLIPFFSDNELVILTVNILVLGFAYHWLFERLEAYDLSRLSRYDLITSLSSIGIAGVLFYGTSVPFHLFGGETNWFWYSAVTYLLIEIPFAYGYMRRHGMI